MAFFLCPILTFFPALCAALDKNDPTPVLQGVPSKDLDCSGSHFSNSTYSLLA